MKPVPAVSTARAIRTPRAAAVAGIVSLLFAASVVLIQWVRPPGSNAPGRWVDDTARRNAVSLSLQRLPFAGIALLWLIGVLARPDRDGRGPALATSGAGYPSPAR